ncbi:hypothetical protein CRUP_024529 [Coryphaenoides rupestris]|nr:hypothetical protein CRUP_024529 [Coryphaenoides rupestris]
MTAGKGGGGGGGGGGGLGSVLQNERLRFIVCFLGVFVFYFYYGILQETITRGEYGHGEKFRFAQTLVFIQCVINALFARILIQFFEGSRPDHTKELALRTVASSLIWEPWFSSNSALQYVNYLHSDDLGVTITAEEVSPGHSTCRRGPSCLIQATKRPRWRRPRGRPPPSGSGEILLLMSLTMDGLTGVAQDHMRTRFQTSAYHMMLNINLWSTLVLGIVVLWTGRFGSFPEFFTILGSVLLFGNVITAMQSRLRFKVWQDPEEDDTLRTRLQNLEHFPDSLVVVCQPPRPTAIRRTVSLDALWPKEAESPTITCAHDKATQSAFYPTVRKKSQRAPQVSRGSTAPTTLRVAKLRHQLQKRSRHITPSVGCQHHQHHHHPPLAGQAAGITQLGRTVERDVGARGAAAAGVSGAGSGSVSVSVPGLLVLPDMTAGKGGGGGGGGGGLGSVLQNERLRFIVCFLGVFVFYFYYGILQETITRGEYGHGEKFRFAQTLVFIQCVINALFARILIQFFEGSRPDHTKSWLYGLCSLSYLGAMVSMMILGVTILRKKYPLAKYLCVLLIVSGVALFLYKPNKAGGAAADDHLFGFGEILLLMSLTMDGLTGVAQDHMRTRFQTSAYHMMLNINLWSTLVLGIVVLWTGEIWEFLSFTERHSSLGLDSKFGKTPKKTTH